jgi:Flp pilus assembly protein TadD
MWLAGCETTSKLSDPLAPQAGTTADPQQTGSVDKPTGWTGWFDKKPPPVSPELLGSDPNDDLNVGKRYFRQGSYGLAERHFRKAVELHPRDGEAWVGLAASYDHLKRFDLADRAYAQAMRILGTTPELLNNQGFSYLIRGDYARARATLFAAQSQAPDNPYIQNNIRLLQQSERRGKSVSTPR